jgi:hypothetical protein
MGVPCIIIFYILFLKPINRRKESYFIFQNALQTLNQNPKSTLDSACFFIFMHARINFFTKLQVHVHLIDIAS